MIRENVNNTKVVVLIPPQQITTNTAIASSYVSLTGLGKGKIILISGARTDGTITPNILHADAGASNPESVPLELLIKDDYSIADNAIVQATISSANTVKQIGYTGGREELAIIITSTGVTTGLFYSVLFVGETLINPTEKS